MPAIWLSLLLAAPGAAVIPAAPEAAIRADVAILADDAMRGREAGTRDFDRAADHVVARMREAGLAPGANGRWRQPVRLYETRAVAPPTLVLERDGVALPLVPGSDFTAVPPAGLRGRVAIAAPLVFVGEGVVDPAGGRDDYRGLDLHGAVAVMLLARPAGYPPAVAALLGDPRRRARLARARGAAGILFVATVPPDSAAAAPSRAGTQPARRMTWVGPSGTPRDDGAPVLATLSPAGAAQMFAGAEPSLAAILSAAAMCAPVPTGRLPGVLRYAADLEQRTLRSANVVGLLRGSDPRLAHEHVVMTAHLDHLGVAATGADRIYNGAQDNAVGVALMLEVARLARAGLLRPRRSILFVALTGEEKGLLGSDYFVAHPPVPRETIVADVNLDMPLLLAPLTDIVVHGGDRSTLGPLAAAAARTVGLSVAPDWEPEQGRFARSDQFSFALAGIPAIALKAGPSGGSAEAQRHFARTRYHRPDDDATQPIAWAAAPSFARLGLAIVMRIADDDARPRWNPDDVFAAMPDR